METIGSHIFLRDKRSREVVGLVIDVISREAPDMLCFWVSRTELSGYLVRSGSGDIYEIPDISPEVINDVRRAKELQVIELDDGAIVRTCCVPSVAGDEPGCWQRAGNWLRQMQAEWSLLGTFLSAVFFDTEEVRHK